MAPFPDCMDSTGFTKNGGEVPAMRTLFLMPDSFTVFWLGHKWLLIYSTLALSNLAVKTLLFFLQIRKTRMWLQTLSVNFNSVRFEENCKCSKHAKLCGWVTLWRQIYITSDAFGLGSNPVAFTSEPYKHYVVVSAASGFQHLIRKECDLLPSSERFGQDSVLITSIPNTNVSIKLRHVSWTHNLFWWSPKITQGQIIRIFFLNKFKQYTCYVPI